MADATFFGWRISPLSQRRLSNFLANRRGFWSLWIFLGLFVLSLFAEVIANDRPLLVKYDGQFYFPVLKAYPETTFEGVLPTEADYRDSAVAQLISDKGWMIWPPIPYHYDTINYNLLYRPRRRPRRTTGLAPTTKAGTSLPG